MKPEDREVNMFKMKVKLIVAAVLLVFGLFLFGKTISWTKLEGNEVAVRQHLTKGVIDEVWLSGTHFYVGWFWDVHVYDSGTQKITFDSERSNSDAEYPSIEVNVGENGGQKAWVRVTVNYHINPAQMVKLHKQGLGKTYESVVLKREIVDTVNTIARPHASALEIYSGKGFVDFKLAVAQALQTNKELKERGIEVEDAIVYGVNLEPQYEAEISGKQIAHQQQLRKAAEVKAAEEEARRIFALSQAKVEEARQDAEAKKIVAVKQAEAKAEQEVLAAQAEKKKRVLEAEGEQEANLARASGLLAVGEAEAKVAALKRESLYAGESGAWRARVEIAQAQAEKMKNILTGTAVVSDKTIFEVGNATKTLTSVEGDTFNQK